MAFPRYAIATGVRKFHILLFGTTAPRPACDARASFHIDKNHGFEQ